MHPDPGALLVTRFGNVPINGRVTQWAATTPPADGAEILRRWELFDNARTLTAVAALVTLAVLAVGPTASGRRRVRERGSGAGPAQACPAVCNQIVRAAAMAVPR
ncbi:hypothetical protein [Streptomyces sp. NPDC092370]|uniref:hypothetical protein n=1 Tax=Streptomyces sp. NPDC092370 TaxID=3366016 RepID=UPI00382B8F04